MIFVNRFCNEGSDDIDSNGLKLEQEKALLQSTHKRLENIFQLQQ